MLASASVEKNYLEILARKFIISATQKQFIQENTFNKATVRPVAFAMKINSALLGSYNQNPFWYQHFNIRKFVILRGQLQSHPKLFGFYTI